ncbi:MAG: site-2 protease family protein [Clostridia bacterium]|nr:site-2 protease family protein [Clostridia bacterium]
MGDTTAKRDGRLSLNPLHHIDWIGALCLMFFHIGWAKPVPINPFMFKNRKWGIIFVSLAGVISNFFLAIISIVAMCFIEILEGPLLIFRFFFMLATVNIGLGIFNLIPIPPLDGSKVLAEFLPIRARIKYLQFERFGWIVLFVLIYFGNFSKYLGIALEFVFNCLFNLIAGVIL